MLIEMQTGDLKYRIEITAWTLAHERMFGIKHHIRVFMRNVLEHASYTVRNFTLTLPHGAVKYTKAWPVTEEELHRLAAQWLDWIEEDLK